MGKELGIPAQLAGQAASELHYITENHIALPLDDLLDGIDEFAGIVAYDGTLLYRNAAWRELAEQHEFFRTECLLSNGKASEGTEGLRLALLDIISGKYETVRLNFGLKGRPARHFALKLYKLVRGAKNFIYIAGSDASEMVQLKRRRQQLGSAVLHAQERERKRIGRELHDSTLQLLVGLQLNLARLKIGGDDKTSSAELLGDCDQILELAYKEIRSISYLYHPPAMGDMGLEAALEAMISGFAKRTGLTINRQWLDKPLAAPFAEISLYRFAQEALTNIYRHAEATTVDVRLARSRNCVHLVIEDDGVGFIPSFHDKTVLGVGVTGMAERLREIGGRVSVLCRGAGTTLIASVPDSQLG
ncbi:MAG: sensor histidine kinase [Porphyrobacter sp.]|nr:sensor histidine kinase [Porphyrobacter sp.]